MAFGLLTTGFVPKPIDQILADIEAVETDSISPSLDLQPTALIGVLNGLVANAASENWQLIAALYEGMDPNNAVGDQLTSVALLTGTKRRAATATFVESCQLITTGSFVGAIAGTLFASVISNPTVLYTNVQDVPAGAGTYLIDFEATTTGPNQVLSGTLTVIAQPVSGWSSITNGDDGIVGSNTEVDSDLRVRRQAELTAPGSATAAAIKADVLEQLPKTVSCTVLHNDGDSVDANGLPPHSIEVIAYLPGSTSDDDQALADLIFAQKAAGINTYSGNSTSKTVTDSEGNTETIYYTRPTAVPIYVDLTALTDPNTRHLDIEDEIKLVLVDYAQQAFQPGLTVYGFHLLAQAFAPDVLTGAVPVVGLLTIVSYDVDDAPAPSGTNVTINVRQVATLNSANINVTITP